MTDFLERATDRKFTKSHQNNPSNNSNEKCDGIGGDDSEISSAEELYSDDSSGVKSSDSSSSGSWSIDDSIEFLQTSHKPLFDELPTFSIRSLSPNGRSMSPIATEPISLFNLSISPISSLEDLTRLNEQSLLGISCGSSTNIVDVSCGKYAKDLTAASEECVSEYDEDERISLDEITASINTPPSMQSQSRGSHKRLNLETIFEGVFLETPPKKRKFESRRTASYRFNEITTERISSYVIEQRKQQISNDTTNGLCTDFDKINF